MGFHSIVIASIRPVPTIHARDVSFAAGAHHDVELRNYTPGLLLANHNF